MPGGRFEASVGWTKTDKVASSSEKDLSIDSFKSVHVYKMRRDLFLK